MKNRLFVGRLAETTTEEELEDLFSRFGEVVEVAIIWDWDKNKSRGFGFVEMANPGAALEALQQLHGFELNGKKLRVVEALDKHKPGYGPAQPRRPSSVRARAATPPPGAGQVPGPPTDPEVAPEEPGLVPLQETPEPRASSQGGFQGATPIPEAFHQATPVSFQGMTPVPFQGTTPHPGGFQLGTPPPGPGFDGLTPAPQQAPGRRLMMLAILALSAAVLALAWFASDFGAPLPEPDAKTILVQPVEVYGQSDSSDYLAQSFAQALAVNLALIRDLKVLPVPSTDELRGKGAEARSRLALRSGAGRMIGGSLVRKDRKVEVSLTLFDSQENRILWGTQLAGEDGELNLMASRLAEELSKQLGVRIPRVHAHVLDLTGSPEMSRSPLTVEALGVLREGKAQESLDRTEKLVRAFPKDWEALALRALALVYHWDAERTPQRLARLERALSALDASGHGFPYAEVWRAYVLYDSGKDREAIERFASILDRGGLAPAAQAWVLRYRAYGKQRQGDTAGALDDLHESLRLDPTNAWTLGILSDVLLVAGRGEEAVSRAQQSISLAPSYWRSYAALGQAELSLGRFEGAAKAFGRACELEASQVPCSLYAITLEKTGDHEQGEAVADLSAKRQDTIYGTYNLACFWALRGARDKALDYLRRSVSLGYADPAMATDSDLDALRQDPEFQGLMAVVGKRSRHR